MTRGTRRRLRRADWLALAEAIVALAMARVAIVLLPFERAMRIGGSSAPGSRPEAAEEVRAVAAVRWAAGAAARRVPWRALCLEQALATRWMLGRRKIAASIHYGVARADRGIEAHAWVMAGPRPVIGCENAGAFTELARFPPTELAKWSAGD